MNFNQLKEKTGMDDAELESMLKDLMDRGIIMGLPSSSSGIMVYYLKGPFPGIFELALIKNEISERAKKLAKTFEKLLEEAGQLVQNNYDQIMPQFKNQLPAMTRVLPVEEEVEVPNGEILPFYEVSKIVDRHDDISLSHCYCRHEKDLLEDPCKITNEKLSCLHFGKHARFIIEQGWAKSISKDEAIEVLKTAENEGLVHKAFHIHFDHNKDEDALCNCCKCCCLVFKSYYGGFFPFRTITSYIASIEESECIGCGICVEKCQIEANSLMGNIANIDKNKCIGCGVCVYHCPQKARKLERTGFREVFIPPPKIAKISNSK